MQKRHGPWHLMLPFHSLLDFFLTGLLMAYEENNKVTPVVSDFDCFLLGTRGVQIHEPFADRDLSMLSWCIDKIEGVLETPKAGSGWTARWLEAKKKNVGHAAHQGMPVFGYADPRSYAIMKGAVHKLRSNGAVRHGPECFNYGFPQVSRPAFSFVVAVDMRLHFSFSFSCRS